VVQPVTLVDSDIVLPVLQSTQLLDLPFSAGYSVAPAIAAVLADTGQQVAGTYLVYVLAGTGTEGSGSCGLVLARRNAANAADIWAQAFNVGAGASNNSSPIFSQRIQLQTNERLVVRVGTTAGTALLGIQANIWIVAG